VKRIRNESKKALKLIKNEEEEEEEENSSNSSNDEEEEEEEEETNSSIIFSSDSENDEMEQYNLMDEEKAASHNNKNKSSRNNNNNNKNTKRSLVKRNLRGETQLHVACIRGNTNQVRKLIEEGHPINERDNLNWLPIHEACNYGHIEITDMLIKAGAKINDMIGPITPLHDAAQNGHLQVVKMLLKGGALSYVFTNEGYTPLDFLCKYKKDNENNLSAQDLSLYRESFEIMLKSIREKDKTYKIKEVITNEDVCLSGDEQEQEQFDVLSNKKNRREIIINEDDDDDDEDDFTQTKNKKKKAVSEYKKAINSIGSKSLPGATGSTGLVTKKNLDKITVSEHEYNIITEDWLINDLQPKQQRKNATEVVTKSYKRKFTTQIDSSKNKDTNHKHTSKKQKYISSNDEDSIESNDIIYSCDVDSILNKEEEGEKKEENSPKLNNNNEFFFNKSPIKGKKNIKIYFFLFNFVLNGNPFSFM
jgi:NF-kappa-B inhibitor-like protein 2